MSALDQVRRRLRRSFAYSLARNAQLHLRNLMDKSRVLPSFIIIGAHKAGTTSFYQNLTSHPQIWPAWTKEVHYFDRSPLPPLSWYQAHFPPERALAAEDGITGEASPSYCLFPHLPELIRHHMPQCKFIMLLRDPVARAYSAHQYNSRGGMTGISFEDWIDRDFRLLDGKPVDAGRFAELLSKSNSAERTPLALLRGIYVEQIKLWHRVFPPEQLLILNSADYFSDPPALLRSVAGKFLGLRDHPFTYHKTRTEARRYPQMRPETAQKLRTFYRPYNETLANYLGRDFGW
ncbi:sulfotransferase domain-containing protein [Parasedimentitalea psychrophila]|uniref:Sulfotransferase domain-containing protein n=1 Tax=Parasedimentitalea psychrophila TaxID=2997337 RepID=A0A9Y2L2V4_9RHOB|nr:sulfotransferase domain-containing protein [Parasedimentitalea psychrophila]WIY27740.1 sulfotransferase domain-containing protein [Parasedimentitalea psychrophila]